ncbi:MAG TPA: sugar ABC transporter substrate-binding protein [Thermoanaerobaculia bacterium]|nr:sugar ABC transporter substrate-binding protein [Thermoanaerobaculia bacterium]
MLAGCGGGEEAEVRTIRFWAMGREGEVVEQLVPEFERRNPGIRVDVQQIPWTAAHEKLLTAYAGKATPDLAQIGNTWIPEFAAMRALAPLDDRVAASTSIRPEAYFPGIWATNLAEGRIYGVPWYVDTRVLFYRRDLLEAAGIPRVPETWDEWRAAMARLRRSGPAERYAILLPIDEWEQVTVFALQNGCELLRDGGRSGAFSSPPCRKAIEFYLGLFHDDLAPVVGNHQIGNLYQQFADGWFAMYITGPWNLGEFRRRLPPELQDHWATAPLPAPRGRGPGLSVAGGSSLVVFRASPRQDAAWSFIEYLSLPETQARFYQLTGDLPARREAWRDPALAADERARAFAAQLEHVAPMPRVPEWEQIAQKLWEALEPAIRGRRSAAESLAALDREVDRILDKRRWLLDRDAAAATAP